MCPKLKVKHIKTDQDAERRTQTYRSCQRGASTVQTNVETNNNFTFVFMVTVYA